MTPNSSAKLRLSRRMVCGCILGIALAPLPLRAAAGVLVHKDPSCGCCGAWAKHLGEAGFSVKVEETSGLNAIRNRLGVPSDLAACHTAEIAGYVVEGHVAVAAINRLLAERPEAAGIAVPGMPQGSPGMSGKPQKYSVVLFGPHGRRTYMEFIGSDEVG